MRRFIVRATASLDIEAINEVEALRIARRMVGPWPTIHTVIGESPDEFNWPRNAKDVN